MKILVTGGTGFVGPKIVHALRAENRDVRVLAHRPEHAARVAGLGVELVTGDVTDPASLERAFDGCTHVIHLVAIIKGRPNAFYDVMTVGTENVVAAAKRAAIHRFVLMSALGVSAESAEQVPYYRSKLAMEQAVTASGLEHVIFRPSFIFGSDGGALGTFMRQVKVAPVVAVIGGGAQRSQPIWVEDVAVYFTRGIDDPTAANRIFELGGPDVVDWNELYRLIAKVLGKRRRYVHIPFGVASAGAFLTQRIPGAPLTTDQVTMLRGADNVVSNADAVETFKLPLVPLEEQIRRAA